MAQKFANAARAELLSTINDTDTSLEIVAGGDLFPVADTGASSIDDTADWFKLVLQDNDGIEIVFVRTHTSGSAVFSDILRGQEGTTAREFLPGTIVGLRPTAGDAAATASQASVDALGAELDGKQNIAVTADSPPSSPVEGQVWTDGTSGITYKWTVDDTSGQWVEHGPGGLPPLKTVNGGSLVGSGNLVVGDVTTTGTQTLTNKTITGLKETSAAIAASNIDLSAGNFFSKTISGTTTFTLSNVPAAGTVASFILDLTNGGSATVNLWSGLKWAGGIAPTLTAAGRDVLGFYTYDGGTTWTGLVLAKDVK